MLNDGCFNRNRLDNGVGFDMTFCIRICTFIYSTNACHCSMNTENSVWLTRYMNLMI